jgi:hypothetical protein
MRLSVYDEHGVLVADADLDPAHPLHEAPDGSLVGHALGGFTPGPGFSRLGPLLEAVQGVFREGDVHRALAMSNDIDALGFWALDDVGRRFRVSNLHFQQGGLLFFASTGGR